MRFCLKLARCTQTASAGSSVPSGLVANLQIFAGHAVSRQRWNFHPAQGWQIWKAFQFGLASGKRPKNVR